MPDPLRRVWVPCPCSSVFCKGGAFDFPSFAPNFLPRQRNLWVTDPWPKVGLARPGERRMARTQLFVFVGSWLWNQLTSLVNTSPLRRIYALILASQQRAFCAPLHCFCSPVAPS